MFIPQNLSVKPVIVESCKRTVQVVYFNGHTMRLGPQTHADVTGKLVQYDEEQHIKASLTVAFISKISLSNFIYILKS